MPTSLWVSRVATHISTQMIRQPLQRFIVHGSQPTADHLVAKRWSVTASTCTHMIWQRLQRSAQTLRVCMQHLIHESLVAKDAPTTAQY
jgi:hypothetical protein